MNEKGDLVGELEKRIRDMVTTHEQDKEEW